MNQKPDAAYIGHSHDSGVGLWARLGVILLAGLFAGFGSFVLVSSRYRTDLQSRANTIASVLDGDQIESLKNPASSRYQANYDYLKPKLAAAKDAVGSGRFVYLMAQGQAKGVYFLVDSEMQGTDGFSPNGQEYPEASDELKASFTSGQAFVEGPVRDRWGTWLSALSVVRDDSGKPVAVLGVDVPASSYLTYLGLAGGVPVLIAVLAATVVYTTENLRRRRQEALRMRSELVSIASHELRSPLSGLRWSQELMMSYPLDDKVKKSLDLMHNSTIKLQESIEDVLQLANLQSSDKHKLDVSAVNVTDLIDDVFSVQQPVALEHHIELKRSDDWPMTLTLQIDERRMKRVFNNLVSNAIKYSKAETAVMVGYRSAGGRHVITVSDHGIGIPKNDQEKVFSGFYRADNARKASVSGTGMGLYLSRAIVEQHGGALWVDSTEQAGTTIYVSLPAATSAELRTTTGGQ